MSKNTAHWRNERNRKIRVKIFGTDEIVITTYQNNTTATANSFTGNHTNIVVSKFNLVTAEH